MMTILSIVFVPPLYFLLRGRWGAFTINAMLCFMALITLFFGIGLIFWILAVLHAGWAYRAEFMEQQAERIASKVATRMKSAP
jgi:hypothetical protein